MENNKISKTLRLLGYDLYHTRKYLHPEDYKIMTNSADEIDRLIAEIEALKAKLQKVESERKHLGIALDKSIEKMRNMGWCAGCKHFKGLKGCGMGELENCNDDNDLYSFFGLEDTTYE